ncbi:caspase-3 (C14 family) [Schistosoma mansoni]|nr:caspase-3 (C14 family) [Schistosoma mansoni]|eukprot:XP_018645797.1 caspase-3 (C14 family) [Schistosoma mansoni]
MGEVVDGVHLMTTK